MNGLTTVCFDVVHWVFALKYWSVSLKIKLISDGRDPDLHNNIFYILLFTGIVLCAASGVLFGYDIYKA